jgi:hypothetical protein
VTATLEDMTDSQGQSLTAAQALAVAVPFELPIATIFSGVAPEPRCTRMSTTHGYARPSKRSPMLSPGPSTKSREENAAVSTPQPETSPRPWSKCCSLTSPGNRCSTNDSPSSGGHGVDLLMMTPDLEKLVAIEIKATLQPHRWPRLRSRRLGQLSPGWLDKPGNTGMSQGSSASGDVYSMAVFVQFARRSVS